ncbi:MAG: sensor histidine kinase [Gammaproteobacteria bacterium]
MRKLSRASQSKKKTFKSHQAQTSNVSFETYQYLFEHHPAPMWVFDCETLRFLLVNQAAIAAYGYSEEEFLSMTLQDIRPHNEHTALEQYVKTPHSEFARAGIWHHIVKDGHSITVEIVSHAMDWSGQPARLVMVLDITEKEQTMRALQESESSKSALLENALDCIISMNQSGQITDFNPAAETTFGWAREFVLGKVVSELIIPPEHREAHQAGLKRYLETGESRLLGRRIEVEALRMDGSRFPAELTLYSAQNDNGPSFTAFLRDVSDRKRAENALSQLNRDLEQKVIDRTRQLHALNHELEGFSYSVSHDLRSPLRAVDGFSQALVEDFGNEISPEARRYLDRIQAATRRMGALIDDLIALARVSRSGLNPEQIDLAELTTEIINELRERDPNRVVSLEMRQPLWAFGDRKLIRIALVNLLQNAWKFSSKRKSATIRVGQIEIEDENPYFIQDNGAGFDMAYADKLFNPFQRLHDSREFEGTGIGLATVQRIVTRHGGRIWVRAEPEKGATFYFTLSGDMNHA